MLRRRRKSDLPTKVCPVCGRPYRVAKKMAGLLGGSAVLLRALLQGRELPQVNPEVGVLCPPCGNGSGHFPHHVVEGEVDASGAGIGEGGPA